MQLNLIITKRSDTYYWNVKNLYRYRSYKGKLQPLQPGETALSVKAKTAILNDIGSFCNMNISTEESFRNFADWYGLEIIETEGTTLK